MQLKFPAQTREKTSLQSKIYEFRKHKRWTLKKLSYLSGIPLNTVWRMEKGYGVTLRNAFTLANIFRVTIYDLWDIVPAGGPAPRAAKTTISLRKLRLDRGWGLVQLAKSSGVSKTTIFGVENGHAPTLENAARIAAALGVSVYDIWKPLRTKRNPGSS